MMSGIRSSNTKPEILVRSALHKLGYRFRLGSKAEKIKPDIVLRRWKVAIFVHGCYWHQHSGCKLAYSDRNYSDKWKNKFRENRKRDLRTEEHLVKEGWRVATIWECSTRFDTVLKTTVCQLDKWIKSSQSELFESDYIKT